MVELNPSVRGAGGRAALNLNFNYKFEITTFKNDIHYISWLLVELTGHSNFTEFPLGSRKYLECR